MSRAVSRVMPCTCGSSRPVRTDAQPVRWMSGNRDADSVKQTRSWSRSAVEFAQKAGGRPLLEARRQRLSSSPTSRLLRREVQEASAAQNPSA